MKRIPPGTTEAFIRANIDYSGAECLIWPFGKSKGYGMANVGGHYKYASHWMCALAHGEAPSENYQAAHSCGNNPCVNPGHLRWATKAENAADKEIHGTVQRGEDHVKTRLTANDVRKIRADSRTQKIIAAEYGISRSSVAGIQTRATWGHLE